MMAALNRHAIAKMGVGHMDCSRVSEHEALVIVMIRDLGRAAKWEGPVSGACGVARTAALIVGAHYARLLLVPMAALAQMLAETNQLPACSIHASDCTRFPNE